MQLRELPAAMPVFKFLNDGGPTASVSKRELPVVIS
jgi:hypothetical protein